MKKYILIPYDEYIEKKDVEKETDKQDKRKITKESMLVLLPKNYRHRASAILDHIEQQDDIDWNDKGEIIIKGETIPYTHISDLLKKTLYSYKNFNPKGTEQFLEILKETNLPQSLLQIGGGFPLTHKVHRIPPPGIPETASWVWHSM